MSKKAYVVEMITSILNSSTAKQEAEMIVERLQDEGLLALGYGDADVDKVVMKFADTFGTTKVSKTDRFAANRLVSKYGSQAVVGIIGMLAEHSQEKYVPVVGSVTQLEDKFVAVMHFLRNLDKGEETIQI